MSPTVRRDDKNHTSEDAVVENIRFVHDIDAARFDVFVGAERASFAEYVLTGDTMIFTHTVTVPQMRGHGYAAQVVRFALDHARRTGRTVVPRCWYVAEFIDDHPEYADLLGPSATR